MASSLAILLACKVTLNFVKNFVYCN